VAAGRNEATAAMRHGRGSLRLLRGGEDGEKFLVVQASSTYTCTGDLCQLDQGKN
jgi:hypothetical protein